MLRRCAILLDELEDKREATPYLTAMAAAATHDSDEQLMSQLDLSLMGRHVVVELKTANALPLLKYACSSRIMALPTSQLNAQRVSLAGLLTYMHASGRPREFQSRPDAWHKDSKDMLKTMLAAKNICFHTPLVVEACWESSSWVAVLC